jgi:hypothetical protein
MDPQEVARPDPTRLLDTANSASQNCAVLHLGFMAVCAYVMVIVFGTTDLDLLVGKGVTLPVVGVAVPIVGYYLVAPFLVVLVHFNLLLQLQLLSRKLYAFDAAAPRSRESSGSLASPHLLSRTPGSRGGATNHFPNRDRWTASPLSSPYATPRPCFSTGLRRHQ